ncbi:unnamed protein product [Rotaria sordida]|uniref:Uncharacterized protein n=1 Tax=Rotaria sordida TaxID=392033 RepID=A0A814SFP8_9BILA|nr:unnamed protein product [Rotaria sordida]CAF4246892.1 unnamed protein product [Rotaria sordida]
MPQSTIKKQSKATETNLKSNAHITKKKQNLTVSTTTKNSHVKNMSRKQLINSLAEMGILTPDRIKIDTLHLLYEENIYKKWRKCEDNLSNSSTSSENECDQHVQLIIESRKEETEGHDTNDIEKTVEGQRKVKLNHLN